MDWRWNTWDKVVGGVLCVTLVGAVVVSPGDTSWIEMSLVKPPVGTADAPHRPVSVEAALLPVVFVGTVAVSYF